MAGDPHHLQPSSMVVVETKERGVEGERERSEEWREREREEEGERRIGRGRKREE